MPGTGSGTGCTGVAAGKVCPEAAPEAAPSDPDGREAWELGWRRLLDSFGREPAEVAFVFERDGRCRLATTGRAFSCLGQDDGRDWRVRLPEPVRAVIEQLAHLARLGVSTSRGVCCNGRQYQFRSLALRPSEPAPGTVLVLGQDVTEANAAMQALHVLGSRLLGLAERDVLLDIANRRCFERSLQREWRRLRREGGHLAVLFVDLDDFKACNDRFGHAWGDVCLLRVATVLQQVATRPADLVARYGGDEFAVLLPDTDEAGARLLAGQMHALLQGQQDPQHPRLTLTIGAAAAEAGQLAMASELLDLADRALYRGKTRGRNCTVAASELAG